MAKFIQLHNQIINIDNIAKVEFLSEDISLEDFPLDEEGDLEIDHIPFTFARVETISDEKLYVSTNIHYLQLNETKDDWYERNRKIIKISWEKLVEALENVTKVTGCESEITLY